MGKVKSVKYTTRNDFDPGYVMKLIGQGKLNRLTAIRILAEACNVIVKNENQIESLKQLLCGLNEFSNK